MRAARHRVSRLTPGAVWMVGLNVLALAGLVLLVRAAWHVITWILVALFIALALEPLVSWLQRWLPRRGLAVVVAYLALLGLVVVLGENVIPMSLRQGRRLAAEAPALLERLREWGAFSWLDENLALRERLQEGLRQAGGENIRPVVDVARRLLVGVGAAIAIPILSFFMLLFGRDVVDSLLSWFEPERRERLLGLAHRMGGRVGGYVGGALLLSTVEGVVVGLLLFSVGVPYFVPLALLTAVLGIIPLLGSAASAVLIGVTTLASVGAHATLMVLVVYLVYVQLDAHVLRPLVHRHTIQMNPLLIALVVLVGTGVAGLLGTLLALPVAAAAQVLLGDMRARREARWRASNAAGGWSAALPSSQGASPRREASSALAGASGDSHLRSGATHLRGRSIMAITDFDVDPATDPRQGASLWGAPFVLGLLLALLGVVALGAVVFTSIASVLLYGALLVVGGLFEVVHAFRIRRSGPFLMFLLGGILSLVVGALVLSRPGLGLVALTLLLAGYFFASGLFRGITSLMDRYGGWGWDFAYGLVSVVLGAIIFAQLPASSLWVLGVVVGVEILTRGFSLMAGSLWLRGVLRQRAVRGTTGREG
jgi:putative heme transporter